jgi:uncharacterized protein YaaN involved in tellurite resistance
MVTDTVSTPATATTNAAANAAGQAASATLVLSAPEVIAPVSPAVAANAVPLAKATAYAVEHQVDRFLDGLLKEDLQSEAFKARLDSAFALGREEISVASSLMQGRFMQRNFRGVEDESAFQAIHEMRGHLDELNPGKDGDLMKPQKILGIIPYGNRVQRYFRKYQSAGSQLQQSMQQLYAARDDMQRDVVEVEAARVKLWDSMQKVAAAARFAEVLDAKLATKIDGLRATDPARAKAIEQEVLFYVRQNYQDMLTQQAVSTNGYLALDVLKKTGREMINGCSRIATTGLSALAVAQTVARATGNQIKVMEMLSGVNSAIEGLIAESGRQLNGHVEKTTQFAENPLLGIEKIKEMFDQTFKAMDAMDDFRTKAVAAMGQNNAMLKEQLARAETYVDRARQREARDSVRHALNGALDGPVAL